MRRSMKRFLPIVMLLMAAPLASPVRADLIHRLTTSTQLSVDGAATQATRIGSTYSVSGNNITAGTMGGLTKASGDSAATAAASQTQGAYSVTTAGSAFSLTESFVMGDAVNPIGTGVDVSTGIVADMPAYGSVTTQSGGVAGSLAGTITSAGVMTLTAGGAGTTATGQFVSEISVD
ncbi:hypothetical protein SSSM7_229 [Synechococcus phage S-SSM7]|uniref:OMP1 protein n=1 Tax=Synechococcus phage S-SSM7 TaxID=445686 RepID=E3SLE6_9CAUD|nr:hypothetical protein SSSM7_229 [Synechococcus phage S-SSM7]ADO98294.1 hypothetical protein SSSM7_229 [Synechococcus phage S-SSM7]